MTAKLKYANTPYSLNRENLVTQILFYGTKSIIKLLVKDSLSPLVHIKSSGHTVFPEKKNVYKSTTFFF